jgi:hypothetical protein
VAAVAYDAEHDELEEEENDVKGRVIVPEQHAVRDGAQVVAVCIAIERCSQAGRVERASLTWSRKRAARR